MRAILKLILVAGVVGLFGFADSIEVYVAGGASLLVLPFLIARVDHRGIDRSTPATNRELQRAEVTMNVLPLPRPVPLPVDDLDDDDIEGKTVRAPMSHEEAYEMHARYAPAFDREAAIARYEATHADADRTSAVPQQDPPSFDQGRYAQALQYADAFEAQLSAQRRTAAYSVAHPRRIARGSYTPQQYRGADTRSDQLTDWQEPRTLIGVKPVK